MKKIHLLEGMLLAVLVVLDQTTKYLARVWLSSGQNYDLIKGVIGLRYAENTGAAFSSFSDSTLLLTLLSAVLVLALAAYLLFERKEERFVRLPVLLILAGGLGNLIDRAVLGYVTDFFELQFMRFAVFNVADVLISGGAVLLVILVLWHGGKTHGAE